MVGRMMVVDASEDLVAVLKRFAASRGWAAEGGWLPYVSVADYEGAEDGLVVIDVDMQLGSGIALAQHLRAHRRGSVFLAATSLSTTPIDIARRWPGLFDRAYLKPLFLEQLDELLDAAAARIGSDPQKV